jgi:hypothetical protein
MVNPNVERGLTTLRNRLIIRGMHLVNNFQDCDPSRARSVKVVLLQKNHCSVGKNARENNKRAWIQLGIFYFNDTLKISDDFNGVLVFK